MATPQGVTAMHDSGKIVVGLVIFVGLVTFPVWYSFGSGADTARPALVLPAGASRCVEDKEYMAANHMDLLDDWRNAVVRQGRRDYVSQAFGTTYEMSLTGTCLGCHTDRETFCDRCHTYSGVEPNCWNCHVEPDKGTER